MGTNKHLENMTGLGSTRPLGPSTMFESSPRFNSPHEEVSRRFPPPQTGREGMSTCGRTESLQPPWLGKCLSFPPLLHTCWCLIWLSGEALSVTACGPAVPKHQGVKGQTTAVTHVRHDSVWILVCWIMIYPGIGACLAYF